MKKMLQLLSVLTLIVSTHAFASPIYTGDTVANFWRNPSLPNESGYYIWSNESRTDWSVRWTGNNNGDTEWLEWAGAILIYDPSSLDGPVSEILFEASHIDNVITFEDVDLDIVAFEGYAGPHWDGFDFSVTSGGMIEFFLGSDLFAGTEDGLASNIFLGGDYANPEVWVDDYPGVFAEQSFMVSTVSVPEPAMLSLFGAGLIGLGFARRASKTKT